jgi:hypothetical protein
MNGFGSFVVVPKGCSGQGWTKVTEELDVDFSITGIPFQEK